jgi:hypothetical protein
MTMWSDDGSPIETKAEWQKFKESKDNELLARQNALPDLFARYQVETDWELQGAVDSWEKGASDTISYEDDEGKVIYAPGTCPGGPHIGKPVFQFINMGNSFADGGTMVAESQNCISFIPAGFKDAPTQNTMNPVREEVGSGSTLMSLVHVLTIPKNVRIYNATTLKPEHKPLLEEMRILGEKAVGILMKGPKEMMGSFKWVYSQTGNIQMNDGSTKSLEVIKTDLSPTCQRNYKKKVKSPEVLNSFHVFPAASIGWLHLHTYIGDLLTTAHDTMEDTAYAKGYRKNTSYDVVVSNIRGDAEPHEGRRAADELTRTGLTAGLNALRLPSQFHC